MKYESKWTCERYLELKIKIREKPKSNSNTTEMNIIKIKRVNKYFNILSEFKNIFFSNLRFKERRQQFSH